MLTNDGERFLENIYWRQCHKQNLRTNAFCSFQNTAPTTDYKI